MKQTLLFFMILLSFLQGYSQKGYEIGAEGGLALDRYIIKDPDNNVAHAPAASGVVGISLRRNTDRKLFYEMALLFKEYTESLRWAGQSGYTSYNSDEVILLPLRAGYSLKITRNFFIAPVIGFVAGYKPRLDGSGGHGFEQNEFNTIYYSFQSRPSAERSLLVLGQGGIGLDWTAFRKRVRFSLQGNYYGGLRNVKTVDIIYQYNNGGMQAAEKNSRGSFINLNAGIKYAF
jgi:hypothetical protein